MVDDIILAAVAGAHGVRGEVRLKLFAHSVESLAQHKAVKVGDRSFSLQSVRSASGGAVARLEGVLDRNAAEALRGKLLSVDRAALPPLEEGEFYYADLIGMACVSPQDVPLGRVVAVENFGAGEIIEIEKPDGKRAMIPLRPGIADIVGQTIVADPAFVAV